MHARKLFGTLVGLALGAVFASPAHAAGLTCPAVATSRAFLPWLDLGHYTKIPGGNFESAGWTLAGGATRVAGNEPWNVEGAGHVSALSLPAGASAVTPPVCISVDRLVLRGFARNTGSLLGAVRVSVLIPTARGTDLRLPVGLVLNPSRRWAPTPAVPVIVSLLTLLTGPAPVRFEFTAVGSGSEWLLDDVQLDPYSKG